MAKHKIILLLVLCVSLSYVVTVTGLLDLAILDRRRGELLQQIALASGERPPDIVFLTQHMTDPDWFVAAATAEEVGALQSTQQLTPDQEIAALQSLLDALASSGHWWRFGWDRDEPHYQQFRGAAITAVSVFGSSALDTLLAATYSESSSEREATCWIAYEMAESGIVGAKELADRDILDRIENLATEDRDVNVSYVCNRVYQRLSKAYEVIPEE
jgi:hypothetical protein